MGGNLLFLDFCTGFPGSVNDSRILRNSAIYAKAESYQILNFPNDVIENVTIRPLILGDGGYPLLTWLMRPYNVGQNIDPRKAKFNNEQVLRQDREARQRRKRQNNANPSPGANPIRHALESYIDNKYQQINKTRVSMKNKKAARAP